jgi:hypothetical protein
MKIANPMYDVAFKYLIEDTDCAKLLLGEIIQKEILECELLHNEIPTEGISESNSGVLRMDFKALVKTSHGKQLLVIIEVQKALKETNLIRFRQYLGSQYSNKNNFYLEQERKIPYPIFSIFILGYTVGIDNSIPIIKVSPQNYDYTLGTEIQASCMFIESLNHEMVIVQTPVLKNAKRSLLEEFLSNFMPGGGHFLEVDSKKFDRKYVSLMKRLEEATMKKEIVEFMQRENVEQEAWEEMVRNNEKLKLEKEEVLRKNNYLLQISARKFLELGLSKETIAQELNISQNELEKLLGC